MSRTKNGAPVVLPWGGEQRVFRLGIGEWRKIEARCNAGPEEIAARLAPTAAAVDSQIAMVTAATMGLTGKWRTDDVREVILQGLIGGGMNHVEATKLVSDYFVAPSRADAGTAYAIVSASLEGLPVSTPGEPDGEGDGSNLSPTAGSIGATSTAAAGGAASPPVTSTQ